MFENFRERLQTVQQDLTTGIKTLGEKSKDVKRRPRFQECPPQFTAGLEILSSYEESWVLLHKRTKDCAQTAEAVDGEVVVMSAHWERRRTALGQLQEQIQALPGFISELEMVTAKIAHLEGDFEEMESRLAYLETLCLQCEQQRLKQQHVNQLEKYKKKKRWELEALKGELDSEHAQKVAELEQATQHKLKEQQKIYEEAFKQDMESYRSTGHLQLREPSGSQLYALDQVSVTDTSDQEALNDFLNSTADDASTIPSITSGPDLESCSLDPPRGSANLTQSVEEQAGGCGCKEDSDAPLVQSDEEDIQVDVLLAVLPEEALTRSSDESDSASDLPSG